jgi:hypothetical protein
VCVGAETVQEESVDGDMAGTNVECAEGRGRCVLGNVQACEDVVEPLVSSVSTRVWWEHAALNDVPVRNLA